MVARNVRNSANSYIYKKKREFELETVKKYINTINEKKYILKLTKHEDIMNATVSKNKEDRNLIDQLLTTSELIPTNILKLAKPIKCQSRYINYRAVVCLPVDGLQSVDQYSDIKSKHLQGYIRHYVKNTVMDLLKEHERALSVKLRLCEPNEEEKRLRDLFSSKNKEYRERNRGITEKTTNIYVDDDKTRFRVIKEKITVSDTRRKIATKEDKKRLLDESKKRMKYARNAWSQTTNQTFSCSFTVLHAVKSEGPVFDKPKEKTYEKIADSVFNKPKESTYERIVNSEPRVVRLEKVFEWLNCLEEHR